MVDDPVGFGEDVFCHWLCGLATDGASIHAAVFIVVANLSAVHQMLFPRISKATLLHNDDFRQELPKI